MPKKLNPVINKLQMAKVAVNNIARVLTKKSAFINLNIVTTNLCNQHCPMCNTTLMRDQKNYFTLDLFKKYVQKLKSYHLASCTISGGEPTLAKELPEIIKEAVQHFPFGVLLITNLYGNTKQIMRAIEASLKNNVNLSISFDGFGEEADILRGSRNVSGQTIKHINMVYEMQKSMDTQSAITLHTVVSDLNVSQMSRIFDLSKKLGWNHSIAPVNEFYYQDNSTVSGLSYTQELIDVCELALKEEHVDMIDAYLKGLALYAEKKSPKLCPYTTNHLKTYKFFLEPNGDVSLCDRIAIGNINEQHIDKMVESVQYKISLDDYKECEGCWLGCFVEPALRMQSSTRKEINDLYEAEKVNAGKLKTPPFNLKDNLLPVISLSENLPANKPAVQVSKK
ncbi:MAG: hypothetical protein IEMM0008_0852 [bacterium]|nr:MAG: hypothetical protein IEMM0008_0852 [bacterium]